jgi:hypothetical protein
MALTTNTQSNNAGVSNVSVGSIVTDAGAAADTTITLGFNPRSVTFVNVTDRIQDVWYEGMPAFSSIHTIAAGTVTNETTNGISVGSNGFTVKAATILASKTFAWYAER